MNKTDNFEQFDPTQIGYDREDHICWDQNQQRWVRRKVRPSTSNCDGVIAEKDKAIEDLRSKLALAQEELKNTPNLCDVLKENLEPIYDIGGNLIFYGVKSESLCAGLFEPLVDLSDNPITNVA